MPPDGFSATGQLWGNPLYNWEVHRNSGYEWWIKRIANCFRLYDVVRIDHFRGFDEYYAIPYGDATAEMDGGKKDLESICSVLFPQVLVTGRSSQKTLDI